MSTKVYEAYRLKRRADFWAVAAEARARGEAEAKRRIRKLTRSLAGAVKADGDAYKKALELYADWSDDAAEIARLSVAHDAMLELWRAQLGELGRNALDFRASLVVTELRGRVYLRPVYGDPMRDAFRFLAKDDRLEDASYWNNTDKPPEISQGRWDRRGRVWRDMGPPLALVVAVDGESFRTVDPYVDDAMKRTRKRFGK